MKRAARDRVRAKQATGHFRQGRMSATDSSIPVTASRSNSRGRARSFLVFMLCLGFLSSSYFTYLTKDAFADTRPTNPNLGPTTSELLSYQAPDYRYLIIPLDATPPSAFEQPSFDDTGFSMGSAAFGSRGGCDLQQSIHTDWQVQSQLLVRRIVAIPPEATDIRVMVSVDNDIVSVFFDGMPLIEQTLGTGSVTHDECPILDEFRFDVPQNMVQPGSHLVAVHVIDRGDESFLDTRILAEMPRPIGTTFGPPTSANPSGTFAEPVNTATGNYLFRSIDLALPGRRLATIFSRTYNSLDDYRGPFGRGWTHSYNVFLTEQVDGSIVIKQGDGHEESYEPIGEGAYRPTSAGVFNTLMKNGNGTFTLTTKEQLGYEFSTGGQVTRISDANGNALIFSYDAQGNLSAITDTVGRTTILRYDSANRLVQTTDLIGRTVIYTYDENGNLASDTDPKGGVMHYSYDAAQRIDQITDRRGNILVSNTYDVAGRVVSQMNGRNFTTNFAYDTPGRGDTSITDPRGHTTIHSHDSQFRLTRVTDPLGNTATIEYDENNNRTSITSRNGNVAHLTYDERGNNTTVTDPLGNTTVFTYNSKNNITSITNARKFTTTFTYDAAENMISIQDPLGNLTRYTYDGFGQLLDVTNALGNVTRFAYDGEGNVTDITNALGGTTIFSYDTIGRLIRVRDPNGHTAAGVYNANSQLVELIDPLTHATQFTYDASGNLVQVVDAKNNATRYGYDEMNNLVTVVNALGHLNRYTYDANNNRTAWINANGHATTYAFDALNRGTTATDAQQNSIGYSYDAAGNVTGVQDAKGARTNLAYDGNNLLTQVTYGGGLSVTYSYDADRNRTSMTDRRGVTSYTYDPLARLVQVVHPDRSVVAYDYDSVNNRTRITYPDGKELQYGYDALNRLTSVTPSGGKETRYGYDSASNVVEVTYPNGTIVSHRYDAADQLLGITHKRGEIVFADFTYALDELGNRTKVVEDGLIQSGVDLSFEYDAVAQLVAVNKKVIGRPSQRITYEYDPVGNRLSIADSDRRVNYQYDAANQLLKAGNTIFTYDANGSRISKAGDQNVAYSYDAANRLIRVTQNGTDVTYAYDGDGNKIEETMSKEGRIRTIRLVYDLTLTLPVVLTQEEDTGQRVRYNHGLTVISEDLTGEESTDEPLFYHADGLGSTIALTDGIGDVQAQYRYDTWGNLQQQIGNVPNRFLFTGEEQDTKAGLLYLRARWYDPQAARFLTKEPFPGMGVLPPAGWGSGISLAFGGASDLALPLGAITIMPQSEYVYAHNNPITFIDPLGLWSLKGALKTIGSGLKSAARSSVGNFVIRTAVNGVVTWGLTGVITAALVPIADGFAPILGAAAAGFIGGAASQFAVSAINGEFGRVPGGLIGGRILLAGTFGTINGLIPVVGPLWTGNTTIAGLSVGEQVYTGLITRGLSAGATGIATQAAIRSTPDQLEVRRSPLTK